MYQQKDVFFSLHKKIAIKPLINKGIQAKKQGGFSIIAQRTDLVEAVTLFDADLGSEGVLVAGSKILLHGESTHSSWNKAVQNFNGQEFVLVPYEEVLFVAEPSKGAE